MVYSSLYTNDKRQKYKFLKQIESSLCSSNDTQIASGYIGTSTVVDLESKLVKAATRGTCKLLVGMVYHGGVTSKQKIALESLDKKLRTISVDSGVYITREQYHGKIYQFINGSNVTVYLGSSNFSKEGLESRHEASVLLTDESLKTETKDYLDYLFKLSTTEKLEDVELKVKGSKRIIAVSTELEDYEVDISEYPDVSMALGICDIKLRVDKQPKSSLNLYFDKGRKNKAGKYAPRPWYEVEITATTTEITSKFYPPSKLKSTGSKAKEGTFVAYFKEDNKYYKINMVVHADNGKNISSDKSSGGRSTLGKIIKGRLERAGLLKEGELITSDTLDAYGNDKLRLYKINSDTYVIDF